MRTSSTCRSSGGALDHHDPFTLESVSAGEEHLAPLQEADVVLLANVARLDPSSAQAL